MSDVLYELLLKLYPYTPTGSSPARQKQLEQFRNPNKDVFPKQLERPTDLSKYADREFRSMREFLPDRIFFGDAVAGTTVPDKPTKLPITKPGNAPYNSGLGNSTFSVGKDPKGKGYLSVFDSWDFDEPLSSGVSQGADEYLRKIGTPFNVYDRYYFAGDTIPAWVDKNARTEDIELPAIKALKKVK